MVPLRLQMGKSQVNVTQSIDKVLTMSSDRFIRWLNDARRPKARVPDFNQANFADYPGLFPSKFKSLFPGVYSTLNCHC